MKRYDVWKLRKWCPQPEFYQLSFALSVGSLLSSLSLILSVVLYIEYLYIWCIFVVSCYQCHWRYILLLLLTSAILNFHYGATFQGKQDTAILHLWRFAMLSCSDIFRKARPWLWNEEDESHWGWCEGCWRMWALPSPCKNAPCLVAGHGRDAKCWIWFLQLWRCSPDGHLYCKECIYDCLLQQKQETKRQNIIVERQEARLKVGLCPVGNILWWTQITNLTPQGRRRGNGGGYG